jgi:glyoxylase-like metal-dependent hydrolase (beta-lactamase superfamily II)
MNTLSSGLDFVDVQFQGVRNAIATVVLHGRGGVALIDPGPSTCLPALRSALEQRGISVADLTTVFLTHVHLDHAGACGTLLHENPRIRVYVHERGAGHLIAPDKLLASARRLWPDTMDRLWGEVLPVPASAIVSVSGDERIRSGERTLEVAYTPGHASHHVSYFDEESGFAFVGDIAGIRIPPSDYVVPPTPPPDIDVDLWRRSIARVVSWGSQTLFMTHFGPASPVDAHLTMCVDNLEMMSRLVRASLHHDGSDRDREEWFVEQLRKELRRHVSLVEAEGYERVAGGGFGLNWRGLARYLRR